MAVEYPATIPDVLTRFGINPLDFTNYTDLLRELQEVFDTLGTNPQGAQATVGNRFIALENAVASPAKLVITNSSTAILNTAVETAFSNGAYTVFGNTAVPGSVYRVHAGGIFSCAGSSATLGFTLRWGSTNTDPVAFSCTTPGFSAAIGSSGWWLTALVTIRTIGGAGSLIGAGMLGHQATSVGTTGGVVIHAGGSPVTNAP